MIKLATDESRADILSLAALSPYGVKISSNLLSYGFNFNFLKFWVQYVSSIPSAVVMDFGSIAVIEATFDADFDELAAFINSSAFIEISARQKIADKLNISSCQRKMLFQYQNSASGFLLQEISDLKEVYGLISKSIPNSFKDDDYSYWSFVSDYNHRKLQNLARSSAVYQNGQLVSCCLTSAEDENRALISGVASNLNYRGKGYGKAAVCALAESLISMNKDVFIVALNLKAEGFYQKIGFKKADVICFWSNNNE